MLSRTMPNGSWFFLIVFCFFSSSGSLLFSPACLCFKQPFQCRLGFLLLYPWHFPKTSSLKPARVLLGLQKSPPPWHPGPGVHGRSTCSFCHGPGAACPGVPWTKNATPMARAEAGEGLRGGGAGVAALLAGAALAPRGAGGGGAARGAKGWPWRLPGGAGGRGGE